MRNVALVDIAGKQVELHVRRSNRVRGHRIVVRYGLPPELVVRPRATDAQIDEAIDFHKGWLERQLAKPRKTFALGLQREDVVWIGGLALPLPSVPSVEAWYREQARDEVLRVLRHESQRLRIGYRSVTIRDQRSRWGSCSSRGALSFNWRLILAPQAILAYVVVHELCHRLRHDHSALFWQVVALARPTYESERKWLSDHGHELLAYRVPERLAA
jgi:predicted metal-dependent hydrolase